MNEKTGKKNKNDKPKSCLFKMPVEQINFGQL